MHIVIDDKAFATIVSGGVFKTGEEDLDGYEIHVLCSLEPEAMARHIKGAAVSDFIKSVKSIEADFIKSMRGSTTFELTSEPLGVLKSDEGLFFDAEGTYRHSKAAVEDLMVIIQEDKDNDSES